LKIAISGKGGIGKTTFAALLSNSFQKSGLKTFAIDADPDANLANALGFPPDLEITPLAEMNDLIKERVGAEPGKTTAYFKMNPLVDDIPDKFSVEKDGIKLMAMGTVRRGGSGCVCPENVMVRSLISHLLIHRDEVVILDMEAGVEHLGRGTARFVDLLLVVVGPTTSSIQTFGRIKKLAADLNMKNIAVIANQIRNENDFLRIKNEIDGKIIAQIPFSEQLLDYHGGEIDSELTSTLSKIVSDINENYKPSEDKLS
jgi:CO dehydrogenase maturation factor